MTEKTLSEKEVIEKGEETQALKSSLGINVAGTTGYQELPAKRPLNTDAPSSEKTIKEPICPNCGNYLTLVDTGKVLIKGTKC